MELLDLKFTNGDTGKEENTRLENKVKS